MSYPAVTEEQFQRQVIDLAKLFKWRVHHTRPAQTTKGWRTPIQGDKGFPDLVLARRGIIIFAELKSENGRQTLEQKLWETELDPSVSNILVRLWRPSDLSEITETLR